MSRRRLDPLKTSPGALQAFAAELTRITASGDWLDMVDAAKKSDWFAPPPRCACCGAIEYSGRFPNNPTDHALEAIAALREVALIASTTDTPMRNDIPEPSFDLMRKVRIGFINQRTTFTEWCRENGIHCPSARAAVIGSWDGQKGKAMRRRIVRAARIGAAA